MSKKRKSTMPQPNATPPEMAVALETERSDRARTLAREETDRAVAVAEKRAREMAMLESRLSNHDEHFKVINGSVERTAKALEDLKLTVLKVVEEKKSIVNLQNRQIAVVAAIGMIVYLIIHGGGL